MLLRSFPNLVEKQTPNIVLPIDVTISGIMLTSPTYILPAHPKRFGAFLRLDHISISFLSRPYLKVSARSISCPIRFLSVYPHCFPEGFVFNLCWDFLSCEGKLSFCASQKTFFDMYKTLLSEIWQEEKMVNKGNSFVCGVNN